MTETNRIEFKRELTREMVESLASGMNRIMSKYSRDNFEFGGNYVRMIVPYNWIPKEGEVENEESQKSSHETEVDEKVNEKVNERQRLIISVITQNPYITQSELAKILEISLVHVNKNMKKLQEKGLIRRIGPDKGGHWEVVDNEQFTMNNED